MFYCEAGQTLGMGWLERLWSLPPWRYSKPNWTEPWATCCSGTCFSSGTGLRWSPRRGRLVPTSLNCSVIPWKMRTGLTYPSFTFHEWEEETILMFAVVIFGLILLLFEW